MNSEVFDAFTRRFAATGEHVGTRRALLRALGFGAGVSVLGQSSVQADPVPDGPGYRVRLQSTQEPTLIDEIAFELEYDTKRIFEFVADEIRYEPYAGALRGPVGTLWAGAGNSVDKAQLLAAMLEASFVPVRFASGEADGALLLKQYESGLSGPKSTVIDRAITGHLATTYPEIDPDTFATPTPLSDRVDTLRAELLEEATGRVSGLADRLVETLRDSGIPLVDSSVEVPAAEVTRHTWVQIANGPDWIDLDPTLPDRQGTMGEVLDALPDDWFHTITVRVSYDKATGDAVERVTSLEHTVRSQDLINGSFALIHVESENLTTMGFDLGAILEGRQGFHPTILAGTEFFFASEPLTFGAQGGVLDAFDDEVGLAEGEAIAEFFEVEVRSPGDEPLLTGRMIFDRAADQRSRERIDLAGISPVELTDIGTDKRQYLPLSPYRAFASISGRVPDRFSLLKPPVDSSFNTLSDAARGIQSSRQAIAATEGAVFFSDFINRPNVVAYTYSPSPDESGDLTAVEIVADLLVQSSRGASREAESPFGIKAGVISLVAEEMALDSRLLEVAADEVGLGGLAGINGATVGRIFAAADEQQIAWSVVSTRNDLASLASSVTDEARILIGAQIEGGRVVVIPAEQVEIDGEPVFGWWVYDPVTGVLFDQLADGRSGALVSLKEYALKLQVAVYAAAPFLTKGECIAALATAANRMLSGNSWSAVAGAVQSFGACG